MIYSPVKSGNILAQPKTNSNTVKSGNILAQPKTNSNRSKLCTNVKYEP